MRKRRERDPRDGPSRRQGLEDHLAAERLDEHMARVEPDIGRFAIKFLFSWRWSLTSALSLRHKSETCASRVKRKEIVFSKCTHYYMFVLVFNCMLSIASASRQNQLDVHQIQDHQHKQILSFLQPLHGMHHTFQCHPP